MSDELEPLDPELSRLLDVERARPPVPHGAHDRLLGRLEASLAAGAVVAGAAAGTAAKGAATKSWIIALTMFAFGGAVGAGAMLLRKEPEPRVVTVEKRVEVPVPVTVVVSAPAAPPPSLAPSTSLAPPPTPATKPSTDAGEVLALDKIRSALKSGDSASALAAVAEHEKRYPSGAHVEEREALAVQALARAGRRGEASARADRFRKRFPSSFFTSIVNAAAPTP
jgi:hypothetical protein